MTSESLVNLLRRGVTYLNDATVIAAADEIEQLRAERDEARRKVCHWECQADLRVLVGTLTRTEARTAMSDDAASSEAYAWEKAREDVPCRRVMCPRCGQHDWHYGPAEATDGTLVCWVCLRAEGNDA